MSSDPVIIEFDSGTLLVQVSEALAPLLPEGFVYDRRVRRWRGEAILYSPLILLLHGRGIPYDDRARGYRVVPLQRQVGYPPRDYQLAAVTAWHGQGRRGVIVLPTGTGKSLVAQLAMADSCRSTLVVVPTLDLLEQWASQLTKTFGLAVGTLGGGSHDLRDVTVATYDSALLGMEYFGNRFGLLVADECHHLPGASYRLLARLCLAPYRLGLTATPERPDGEDESLDDLMGPICYRKEIDELEGVALAPYRTVRLAVELEDDEFAAYQEHRSRYVNFLHAHRVNLSGPDGWSGFLRACSRMPGGHEAFQSYLEQRRIAIACRSKLGKIWELLRLHHGERVLIFTADNQTAYGIGRRFCLPVLTHHTKLSERRAMLSAFREGTLPYLVTSKVLNEGVDVPEASVGIVVSGSGSIREHVQRLGRILRPAAGKQAVLYELISMGTGEMNTSERRRQHRAYERFATM